MGFVKYKIKKGDNMEILEKVNKYNEYTSGFYIYAIVYPEKFGGSISLYYKYPMKEARCFVSFDTADEFLSSDVAKVLKENGFIRVIDEM